jgi:hypothetical protein
MLDDGKKLPALFDFVSFPAEPRRIALTAQFEVLLVANTQTKSRLLVSGEPKKILCQKQTADKTVPFLCIRGDTGTFDY